MDKPSGTRAKNVRNVEPRDAGAVRHDQIERVGRPRRQAPESWKDSDYDSDDGDNSLSTVEVPRRANVKGGGGHRSLHTKGKAKAGNHESLKQCRTITPKAWEIADSDTDEEDAGDTRVVIAWSEAPSPWGAEGYQEGDAALFANENPGREHFEAILPSHRFEWDPFAVSSAYSTTHRTNEEGFQVVELRRDPLAQLDWGFTAERHEFGGACLITSVDAVSPAASAVRSRNEATHLASPNEHGSKN
jgi:hypothetical protein